jgi:hypothetical protein
MIHKQDADTSKRPMRSGASAFEDASVAFSRDKLAFDVRLEGDWRASFSCAGGEEDIEMTIGFVSIIKELVWSSI